MGQKLNDPQTLNRYTYCENNPLRYTDPTGHWPNWGSIGSFCKGFDESIISCTLPYQLYTLTKATVQLCTELTSGQKTIQDLFTPSVTPTQALNNIVNGFTDYYNVTTPEGAGHLAGTIILTAATAALGAAGACGSAEAAASDACKFVDSPPGALDGWTPKIFEEGDTFQRYGDIQGHYGAPVGQSADASALSPASIGKPLNIYQFNTSWDALQSTVKPAFNQTGLGQQFYYWPSIEDLLNGDIISDITPR